MHPAFYNDGKTAQRHAVELTIVGDGLWLRTDDGELDENWSGAGIRLLEEAYSGKPLRLQHTTYPDAVITIEDAATRRRVLDYFPHLSARVMRGSPTTRLVGWTTLAAAAVVALVVGIPTLAASASGHLPDEWTAQLGNIVVASLVDEQSDCTGNAGLAALDGLVERLRAVSGHDGPVSLRVADLSAANAIAAPGGNIVVFRGLIDEASNGDQVAAVIAHEMAHVTENHPLQGIARQLSLRFVIALMVGDFNGLAAAAANLGGDAMSSNYSRTMESDADRIAVSLLNDAGFDASGLEQFFRERLTGDDADAPGVIAWLSSHPTHAQRIEALAHLNRGGTPTFDESQWRAIRAVCHGV